ncbi:trypsin-like peptidase domain-containing protein [Chitinimonas sp.]|uniref:trypsin-like peptidase domain-containing protein n=1 Tax=Chitinimonas sp. TaxID=1934313 RepID=UPI0035AEB11C
MSQSKKTLYAVLGVARDADAATISEAYASLKQRIASEPHGSERDNQLGFIEHAFQTLHDPARRARYEQKLHDEALAVASIVEAEPEPSRRGWIIAAAILAALLLWAGLHWLRRSKPAPAPIPYVALANSNAPINTAGPQSELTPAAIFRKVSNAIVVVIGEQPSGKADTGASSLGSGVVIGPAQVVTNCHVTAEFRVLRVRYREQLLDAQAKYVDRGHDLCLLEVPQLDAPAITVGSVNNLNIGDRVVALGTPQGLELTLSEGVVSALRRHEDGKVIQTSAPISPGSSGGGLFDRYGQLVGITTFQLRAGQNLNFAVPADWIAQLEKRNGNQDRLLPDEEAPSDNQAGEQADRIARHLVGHWSCTASNGNTQLITLDFGANGSMVFFRRNSAGKVFNTAGSYRIVGPDALVLDSPELGAVAARLVDFSPRHTMLEFGFSGERVLADCNRA